MSGPRPLRWLMAGLTGALLAGLLMQGLFTRQALQTQLEAANRTSAAALAATLAQQAGGPSAWRAAAAAQFAAGGGGWLRIEGPGGEIRFQIREPAREAVAPDWFTAVLPVAAAPGRAAGSGGLQPDAVVVLAVDPAAAQDALWAACSKTARAALVLWLLACAALRWWPGPRARGPVPGAVQQAHGAAADADGGVVRRLREEVAVQAEEVSRLQRQAQLDLGTGLPLRRHFLGQLEQCLSDRSGPGVALLMVRVLQLEAMNLRLGHAATDHLLSAVADILLTYVDRVAGAFAGRLNGSDFALCLPVAGVALETAESLRIALAAAPAMRSASAEVVVGGVDGLHDSSGSQALAAADAALARAEADLGNGPVVEMHARSAAAFTGAQAWRAQITSALAEGRTRLAEIEVRDRAGLLIHLECPLQVQLAAQTEYQAAERWLALARRSRLMPQLDLTAVELALRATAVDGRRRAVHASSLSLATPAFVAQVSARLSAAPAQARLLAIECTEGPRPSSATEALAAAVAAWHPLGVRVGVEHATAAAEHLPALQASGVDYVKVDAHQLQELRADPAVQGYAGSLVSLIHDLGLTVLAVGVDDARDLALLWALGFDGVGGPAVAGV